MPGVKKEPGRLVSAFVGLEDLVDYLIHEGRGSDVIGEGLIDLTREVFVDMELDLEDDTMFPIVATVGTYLDGDNYALIPVTTADGDKLWGVWWLDDDEVTRTWIGYQWV